MKNLTLEEFTARTGSGEPTPGGGSISAFAGALSAALTQMVAGLTAGKEKYADVRDEMESVIPLMQGLSEDFLDDIERDSASFDLYMKALSMPKETEAQAAERKEAMQEGLKAAVFVPLKVAEKACGIFPYSELMIKKGNATAVTDALVGALMARTAVLGACANVRINLKSVKDTDFVRSVREKVAALEESAIAAEEKIRALAGEKFE